MTGDGTDGTQHGTALALGSGPGPAGLLITGPSGSGKSTLALSLIQKTAGFAALVSDDLVQIDPTSERLVARYPKKADPALRGIIEVRGVGLVTVPHVPSVVLTHWVELPDAPQPRLPIETARRSPVRSGPEHSTLLHLCLATNAPDLPCRVQAWLDLAVGRHLR